MLFEHFSPIIKSLTREELKNSHVLRQKLKLADNENLQVCYAPFEYINTQARVVIVGITPGHTQMLNAVLTLKEQLVNGANKEEALIAAKKTAAFSGAMRPNLVALLDKIGLNQWLRINSCDALFAEAAHLVQTTSILRNPVFIKGENYNGHPSMVNNTLLKNQLITYFGEDVKALPDAVFVPLGDKVTDGLNFLASEGMLPKSQILEGLPHPSGANAERISYFLGKKDKNALSIKTNANKIDEAKEGITAKVLALS